MAKGRKASVDRKTIVIAADSQTQALLAATRILLDQKHENRSINLHSNFVGSLDTLS
jgi:hypothetical protein